MQRLSGVQQPRLEERAALDAAESEQGDSGTREAEGDAIDRGRNSRHCESADPGPRDDGGHSLPELRHNDYTVVAEGREWAHHL